MFATFFIAWVAFSFLAHKLAKCYFQFVSEVCGGDTVTMTLTATLVTGIQLLTCGVLTLVRVPKTVERKDKNPSLGVLFIVAIPHTFGALMTNYSMALIPAASTHLIKVMEPMVTAVIAWFAVGVTVSKSKLLALVLVLIGAVGASWDPSSTFPTHGLGMQIALLSNLLYAARNVSIKHLLGRSVVFEAATMGRVSLLGAIILLAVLPSCSVASTSVLLHIFPRSMMLGLAILAGSAICHATYTYISTCVILQYISVIGHALANVAKRVLVIVLLYLLGKEYFLSPPFVVVCFIGLLVYIWSSQTAGHENLRGGSTEASATLRKPRILVMVLTVASVALAIMGVITNAVPSNQYQSNQYQSNQYQSTHRYSRLIDQPNITDSSMSLMHSASAAVQEAQRIHLQIFKELIGNYKKAILVGLSNNDNKGDSAITIGEFETLNKLRIEVIYYCSIPSCGNFSKAKAVVSNETEPVVVLTHGGGDTCIWKIPCLKREKLVQTFPDREILVFPQSVKFDNKGAMKSYAAAMKHPNITYLFRDHQSYNIFVNSGLFQYKNAVLCPDSAMQIGMQQPPIAPTHDIVWLKRTDIESQRLKLPEFPSNLSVFVEDWLNIRSTRAKDIKDTSYNRFMDGLKFLSRGKVVVSDRLHAHILSVMLNKPHVVLDNSYKKVSGYHMTWTPSVDNALLASNTTDALEKAQYLLQKITASSRNG